MIDRNALFIYGNLADFRDAKKTVLTVIAVRIPRLPQKHYPNVYEESTEKTRFLARLHISHSTTETGFFGQNDLFSVKSL
jgi:hypothetical protein